VASPQLLTSYKPLDVTCTLKKSSTRNIKKSLVRPLTCLVDEFGRAITDLQIDLRSPLQYRHREAKLS